MIDLDLISERLGRFVDVGSDDFFHQSLKLAVGQSDVIERFKLVSEIRFEARPVLDVLAIHVAQALEVPNEMLLYLTFFLGMILLHRGVRFVSLICIGAQSYATGPYLPSRI